MVTGAGRPGVVREAALAKTASDLAKDGTLRDSLGNALSSHAKAQARKLRGQRARDEGHRRQRHRRPRRDDNGSAAEVSIADVAGADEGLGRDNGGGRKEGTVAGGDWAENEGSATGRMGRAAAAAAAGGEDIGGWEESTFESSGRREREEQRGVAGEREDADLVSA